MKVTRKQIIKIIKEYGTYSQRVIHRGRYPSTGPDYGGNLTIDDVREVFPTKTSGEQIDIHDEFGESTNNAGELKKAYIKKYGSLHEGRMGEMGTQLTDEIVDLLIERRVIQLPRGGAYDDVLYQDALDYVRDNIIPTLKNLAATGAWERK